MIYGILGFFSTALLIIFILESSLMVEEYFAVQFEMRKGFTGAKSSLFKVVGRHLLRVLRLDESKTNHFISALKAVVIFLAAGLLPSWNGHAPIVAPHSLWIFLGLVLFGPIFHLLAEWVLRRGLGWPAVLTSAERNIGSATVIFTLGITLVAMTGVDTFEELSGLQNEHGWLIARYPTAILLLFVFSVLNLFTSFQTIFSRTGDRRPIGRTFNDLLPYLRRSIWTLFIVDVFLGGAGNGGPLGWVVLVFKAVALNALSGVVAFLFFQLREDQAEAFILWRLAPLSVIILALALLFPGGLF